MTLIFSAVPSPQKTKFCALTFHFVEQPNPLSVLESWAPGNHIIVLLTGFPTREFLGYLAGLDKCLHKFPLLGPSSCLL
jgi:hypothetical protein